MVRDFPQHVGSIIRKFNLNISQDEFLKWLNEHKADHRNYIRIPSVKPLFLNLGRHNGECTKIMRIFFHDFVKRESTLCFLTSKKTKNEGIIHNLKAVRSIERELQILGEPSFQ
jgi:hypothetical protein